MQNGMVRYHGLTMRRNEKAEIEVVKSPKEIIVDKAKAVVADYERWEEKLTHITAPTLVWLGWSVFLLITGAVFGMQCGK